MPSVEKILKKVEQERSKGNDERALSRLKDAIIEHPSEYSLARQATAMAFQLGRTLEGVGILRTAMRRCPRERNDALRLAEDEFARGNQLEIGELLFDAYLSQPDFEKARDVLNQLLDRDREKLLSKLRSKIAALKESAPEEKRRLIGLLYAEALILSAMERPEDVARALDRILNQDAKQTETVGPLCKIELQSAPNCDEARLLMARCYLNVNEPGMAAEQLLALGDNADTHARALALCDSVSQTPALLQVRAQLLLASEEYDASVATLDALLDKAPESVAIVRRTIEQVPGASRATEPLRRLYARVLAETSSLSQAVRELEDARKNGADAERNMKLVDDLLEREPRDPDLLQLRARLALDLERPTEAAPFLLKVLEVDRGRARSLRKEIESAYEKAPGNPELGKILVELLVQLELPEEAARIIRSLRDAKKVKAENLFELTSLVASKFGLSASLTVVFVEAALDIGRDADARAAVAHYMKSPGALTPELSTLLSTLLHERVDLSEKLATTLQGLPVPANLRLSMVRIRLAAGDAAAGVLELEMLVAEQPDLHTKALQLLDSHLQEHGDVPQVLELAAEFMAQEDRGAAAAEYLARALRADPTGTDRICRRADGVISRNPSRDEVWRPLVLALVDTDRHRHAREMCYRATQSLPQARRGFVHFAMAMIQMEGGQLSSAAEEFDSALACEDAPIERAIEGLRRIVEMDAQNGYFHFALASALLLQDGNEQEAVEQLSVAVELDKMLVDLVHDSLRENEIKLEASAEARVLEGKLCLKKGDRPRGVALLDEAMTRAPEVSEQVLQALELEWDQSPESIDTGMTLARALCGVEQNRRACRLISDLSRRFPDQQGRFIGQLEKLLEIESLPEAHRVLFEILLTQGEQQKALQHVELAVDSGKLDTQGQREILEAAHKHLAEDSWVSSRLAQLELESDNFTAAENLLRALLERDSAQARLVLETLHVRPPEDATQSVALALLEVDALLAAADWPQAHEALAALRTRFPDAVEEALERLRVLVKSGDTQLAADLDLGLLLQELGKVEEATQVLEAALQAAEASESAATETDAEVVSHEPEIRMALASLYVDLGRESEGKRLLENVLEAPGNRREAFQFLERVNKKGILGKLKNLRETISHSPGNLRARLELSRLSLLSCDFSAAREALSFAGDSPAIEAARLYLLARSYAEEDQPHLAKAVLHSIMLDDIADNELRRKILYLRAGSCEKLGCWGEAHALYLRIVSEFPNYKDAHLRARSTYQKHLEMSIETRALVLEKGTNLDVM